MKLVWTLSATGQQFDLSFNASIDFPVWFLRNTDYGISWHDDGNENYSVIDGQTLYRTVTFVFYWIFSLVILVLPALLFIRVV